MIKMLLLSITVFCSSRTEKLSFKEINLTALSAIAQDSSWGFALLLFTDTIINLFCQSEVQTNTQSMIKSLNYFDLQSRHIFYVTPVDSCFLHFINSRNKNEAGTVYKKVINKEVINDTYMGQRTSHPMKVSMLYLYQQITQLQTQALKVTMLYIRQSTGFPKECTRQSIGVLKEIFLFYE